jgi:hypothetical protein
MNIKVEKFTQGFFWFGYAVFLSASIPHIAAYFRHFDPTTPYFIENAFYWTIAVLLAVVIDVSDVLVSIAVMRAQANGAKFRDVAGYWLFILLIMSLSWFFNWQYNVVYGTGAFHTVDQNVIWGGVTVGGINPVIGSAFQLLLLVYTGMAHKFAQKPKVLSLEDMKKEADEAEQRAEYQTRIDAVKRAQREQVRQNFFESLRQTKKEVTAFVKGEDEDPLNGSIDEESSEQQSELDEEISENSSEEYARIARMNEESITSSETGASESLKASRNGSTKRVYVSLEEAVELLQYELSYVKSLRTKGVLKTAGRNSDLISLASIKSFLSKKQRESKKQSKDEGTPTASGESQEVIDPSGEEVSEHDTEPLSRMDAESMLSATIAALREQPDITEEELMVILGLKRKASARLWKVKAQSLLEQGATGRE